jgi:hypothetical protein
MRIDKLFPLFLETMPDTLDEGVLYVSRKYETAIHLCACGCKGQTVTPLRDGHWTLTMDNNGPTLDPSIGNQHWPCGSHYLVREGIIVWI